MGTVADYIKYVWVNATTPITATRLNAIEQGLDDVTDAFRGSMISGVGSPEGVIAATPPAVYFQTDAASGSEYWDKVSGSSNTGWRLRTGGGGGAGVALDSNGDLILG